MKTIPILLLSLSLIIRVNAQEFNKVIEVTQITGGGNHKYYSLIGSDNKSINKVFQSKSTYANTYITKYCLKPKIVEYISQYIDKNCDSVNRITEKSIDFFIISVFEEDGKQVCCLENKSISMPFFVGLKNWIKNSRYKDECKELLVDIEPYIH